MQLTCHIMLKIAYCFSEYITYAEPLTWRGSALDDLWALAQDVFWVMSGTLYLAQVEISIQRPSHSRRWQS
jgi:hypothetical protein